MLSSGRHSHSETRAVGQVASRLTKGTCLLSVWEQNHPHCVNGSLSLPFSKQNICLCINSAYICFNWWFGGLGFLPVMKGRWRPRKGVSSTSLWEAMQFEQRKWHLQTTQLNTRTSSLGEYFVHDGAVSSH